jgi:hypothetical protein
MSDAIDRRTVWCTMTRTIPPRVDDPRHVPDRARRRRAFGRPGACALLAATLGATSLAAQERAGEPSRGAVRGTVTDDRGAPVPALDVRLDDGSSARTDSAGRFAIVPRDCSDGVRVSVRRPGSVAVVREVPSCASASPLGIVLRPLGTTLGTVRVDASTSGLVGLVTAWDGAPLGDAEIRLVGARRTVRSDSAGRFAALDMAPGSYLVRVRHAGHRLSEFPVTLGQEDVRDVQFLLAPIDPGVGADSARRLADGALDGAFLRELEARHVNRGMNAAMLSREELLAADDGRRLLPCSMARVQKAWRALRDLNLGTCANYAAGCVIVGGRWSQSVPLWAWETNEVNLVEVYGPGGDFTGTLALRAPQCGRGPTIVIWPRT